MAARFTETLMTHRGRALLPSKSLVQSGITPGSTIRVAEKTHLPGGSDKFLTVYCCKNIREGSFKPNQKDMDFNCQIEFKPEQTLEDVLKLTIEKNMPNSLK